MLLAKMTIEFLRSLHLLNILYPDKPVHLKRRTPQITNYKHQITNKFQISMSKS